MKNKFLTGKSKILILQVEMGDISVTFENSLDLFGLMFESGENEATKVTDYMIQNFLSTENFMDLMEQKEKRNEPKHHAHRIASLVDLIEKEPDIFSTQLKREVAFPWFRILF